MCAGCPGGGMISSATAYMNLHGLKHAVLGELRRNVGPRATVTVFGDRWVLRSRTGIQHVLPDIEALTLMLVRKNLLDQDPLSNIDGAPELIVRERDHRQRPPVTADDFVRALLVRAAREISS